MDPLHLAPSGSHVVLQALTGDGPASQVQQAVRVGPRQFVEALLQDAQLPHHASRFLVPASGRRQGGSQPWPGQGTEDRVADDLLQRDGHAAESAATAMRQDPGAVKIRSRLLTSLATAQAQQGDVEQACRLAIESLGIAAQTDTEPSLQDVYTLRQQLNRWSDTEPVRELDDHLAAV